MKVKDLLVKVAEEVGEDRVKEILMGLPETQEEFDGYMEGHEMDVNYMLDYFKIAVKDICRTEIEFKKTIKVKSVKQHYALYWLGSPVLSICSVLKDGSPVNYKRDHVTNLLEFEEDGEYEVTIKTIAEFDHIFDEVPIEFEKFEHVFVLATAAFWFLAHQMVELFNDFHDRYIDEIQDMKNQ